MFQFNRKVEDELPEVRKTILTELDHSIIDDKLPKAKELAEIYAIVTKNDKPAEKPGMSDQVKVAIISAVCSLGGILAIIKHEDVNVIASKALGFITKPKI